MPNNDQHHSQFHTGRICRSRFGSGVWNRDPQPLQLSSAERDSHCNVMEVTTTVPLTCSSSLTAANLVEMTSAACCTMVLPFTGSALSLANSCRRGQSHTTPLSLSVPTHLLQLANCGTTDIGEDIPQLLGETGCCGVQSAEETS